MNAKAKGTRNEHKTRDWLIERGYTVMRAGASLGAFDLVAFNGIHCRFIQVKSNRWAGPDERDEMIIVDVPLHSRKEMWRWDDYKRKPKIKLYNEYECEWVEVEAK